MQRLTLTLSLLLLTTLASAQPAKKLIFFGWGYPSPQFLADNSALADDLGFDGVCLDLNFTREGKPYRLGWVGFGGPKITLADFAADIKILKSLRLQNLRHNFLRMNVSPGDFDYFDRDFDTVVENFRVAAQVAKEAGCVGLLFDPEHYGTTPFNYQTRKHADKKSYEEYQAKVRERGAQVMRAINKSLPDAIILTTWANSIPAIQSKGGDLSRTAYNLLPAWYDGMVSAATDGTKIIDGYESSYGFKDRAKFLEGYHTMLNKSRALSASPREYRDHVSAGFGLWGDQGSKFDPVDFSKNYFTPDEFEQALRTAFEVSDEYVWLYNHHIGWWKGTAPAEYLAALKAAKTPPSRALSTGLAGVVGDRTLTDSAKTRADYPEEVTFKNLLQTHRDLGNLPEADWLFKLDWKDEGLKAQWFAAPLTGADVKTIQIADWWEPQGIIYDGIAWYQRQVTIPANAPADLALAFGAVDEAAWVWIDGQLAGQHDLGDIGWNLSFLIPAKGLLKPGQKHTITIRVSDGDRYGGIWKPIKLVTTK